MEPADGGDDDDTGAVPVPGDHVALTVVGHQGDWGSEVLRLPGIPFAYTRSSGVGGSVTVFLPRASGQAGAGGPD